MAKWFFHEKSQIKQKQAVLVKPNFQSDLIDLMNFLKQHIPEPCSELSLWSNVLLSLLNAFLQKQQCYFSFYKILFYMKMYFFRSIIQAITWLTKITADSTFDNVGYFCHCYFHQYICLLQWPQYLCITKINFFYFNNSYNSYFEVGIIRFFP